MVATDRSRSICIFLHSLPGLQPDDGMPITRGARLGPERLKNLLISAGALAAFGLLYFLWGRIEARGSRRRRPVGR